MYIRRAVIKTQLSTCNFFPVNLIVGLSWIHCFRDIRISRLCVRAMVPHIYTHDVISYTHKWSLRDARRFPRVSSSSTVIVILARIECEDTRGSNSRRETYSFPRIALPHGKSLTTSMTTSTTGDRPSLSVLPFSRTDTRNSARPVVDETDRVEKERGRDDRVKGCKVERAIKGKKHRVCTSFVRADR